MRISLILLIALVSLQCQAQYGLVNRTVIRQDSGFLFNHTPNELLLTGYKDGKWQLKTGHSEVEQLDSPWLFSVEPRSEGPDTISLFRNGINVLTKIFRVIPEPQLEVHWGGIRSDKASIAEVLANKRIIIFIKGCNCGHIRLLASYKINLITNELPEWKKQHEIENNQLSPEIAGLIRQLRSGDKIVFENIRVGCRPRQMPPLTITLQ